MLLRLRIEAEGPTINAVEDDFFATYDALGRLIYGQDVVWPTKLVDENIKSTAAPNSYHARWYRGSAAIVFPRGEGPGSGGVDASRIRPRSDWFAAQDEAYHESMKPVDSDPDQPIALGAFPSDGDHSIVRVDYDNGTIHLVNDLDQIVAVHTGSREAAGAVASALNVTWTTTGGGREGSDTPPDES